MWSVAAKSNAFELGQGSMADMFRNPAPPVTQADIDAAAEDAARIRAVLPDGLKQGKHYLRLQWLRRLLGAD
jgi:hypothetical protein